MNYFIWIIFLSVAGVFLYILWGNFKTAERQSEKIRKLRKENKQLTDKSNK